MLGTCELWHPAHGAPWLGHLDLARIRDVFARCISLQAPWFPGTDLATAAGRDLAEDHSSSPGEARLPGSITRWIVVAVFESSRRSGRARFPIQLAL